MKPLKKADAEAMLRADDDSALKRLPDDVDVKLASRVAFELLKDSSNVGWGFGRQCQQLPVPVIRGVLELLKKKKGARRPEEIFLIEATDPADLPASWVTALTSLTDLDLTYAWGSKQRKAKLRALAKSPRVLAAIQAAVVGAVEEPSLDMLAVLAIDAGDASIDALMPAFSKNDLRLEELEVHATKTPAMITLLETVKSRRETKEIESGAVAFVKKVIGSDEPMKRVKLHAWLSSHTKNQNRVPLIQGALVIDSAWDEWWSVSLTRVDLDHNHSHFGFGGSGRSDALQVGTCTIDQLPAWLTKTAKKLHIEWSRDPLLSGSLRGKKRDAFLKWLFSRQ